MSDNHPELISKIAIRLEARPEVQVATVFGSFASGLIHASSDIDIGIAGEKGFSWEEKLKILNFLGDLTSRTIDLVDLNAVSGTILKQALASGKVIVKKNHPLFSKLLRKMWYDEADFQPYVRRMLRLRREKFLEQK